MMKKTNFIRKIRQTAFAAALALLVCHPVFAAEEDTDIEILPLEALNITEDPNWEEDGEAQIREAAAAEEEDNYYVSRVERYLASGVSSTVYKATEKQGVDVSHHQKYIDWAKVKASGMEFAMIRVGYRGYGGGTINADTYFETNMKNAQAAGMKIGIYFFSQALNEQEAYEEACYTINMIKKYNITYPVAFDWETAQGYRTYSAGLTSSQMNAIATKFCDTVSSSGYIPMVYSNTADFQGRYNYSALSAKYYIWYARYLPEFGGTTWYTTGSRKPNYDNNISYNIWQYMSDGTVPGVSGNCDVNVTFLDFGQKRTVTTTTTTTTTTKPTVTEVSLSASSSSIKIDESQKTITGVKAGDTYQTLREAFNNYYVAVNGGSRSADATKKLKTGDKLTFTPKNAYKKLKNSNYTLYIKGDVDGDGSLSVTDMEKIQKHLLKIDTLSGIYLSAAQVTESSTLTILDMEAVQKAVLGIKSIY